MYSYEYLNNRLIVALGGRAAEEIVFGSKLITTGAGGDFETVTNIARAMIIQYGFSETIGPWQLTNVSDETQAKIDEEIQKLVQCSYNTASQIITENRTILEQIVNLLVVK